jgi:hypothetical protein
LEAARFDAAFFVDLFAGFALERGFAFPLAMCVSPDRARRRDGARWRET